jgi:hypothetical protein
MTKTCTCCGKRIAWATLPLVGYQDNGLGGTLELRNHECGSTLSIHISGPKDSAPPGSARDAQFAEAE